MDKGKVILDSNPKDVFSSEEVRLVGVGIPKATRLYQTLKANGIDLKKIPLCSEEASKTIREALLA
jgi:hypothetical protein